MLCKLLILLELMRGAILVCFGIERWLLDSGPDRHEGWFAVIREDYLSTNNTVK